MGDESKPGWKSILPGGLTKAGSARDYKTGDWRAQRPMVDFNKCIHCLICANICPEGCIPVKEGKREGTDYDYCKGCGLCAQQCPVKCITMKDEGAFRK